MFISHRCCLPEGNATGQTGLELEGTIVWVVAPGRPGVELSCLGT